MGVGSSDRNKSELTNAINMPGNLGADFSNNFSANMDSKQGSDQQMVTLQNETTLKINKAQNDLFVSLTKSGSKQREHENTGKDTIDHKRLVPKTPFANLKKDTEEQ